MSIFFNGKIESYLNGFKQFKETRLKNESEDLLKLREDAVTRFSKLGFPTTKDEDWRFTNISPISRGSFKLPENGKREISSDVVENLVFKNLDAIKLVFIDGKFFPEISDTEDLPEGVIVSNLKNTLETNGELTEKYLAKFAAFNDEAFTALNTAFFEDGIFLYVPGSTALNKIIYALYITTKDESPTIVNIRNLIVVEDNSSAKVIEHYVSTDQSTYLSNVVSEVVIGKNTNVEHYMMEFESRKAYNVSTLRIQQDRDSNIKSHSVLLGGAIVRNNVHPVLAGDGCNSLINGLFMSNNRQHMDNFMKVEHASPHCDSRQFYNGILDGRSRGVFHGRIIVHEGAVKTDAKQTNRNLLLSDTAQIDTKPQLEIYNDDVKCTHGATIGQMDDEAIFYLRSRGIAEQEAKSILLQGFTGEGLSNMSIEPVRSQLEVIIDKWFENRKGSV